MPKLFPYAANPGPHAGRIAVDQSFYERIAGAEDSRRVAYTVEVPVRTGHAWPVRRGQVFRIVEIEGPQVADFNVWNLHNPREHFWSARTRLLQGAHLTTYDQLWSCLPYLRPMLTIVKDTVGNRPSESGGRCHDLLGTRCDPYLYKLVDDRDVDRTCHNNLADAVAPYHMTEFDVHDALNLFQASGIDPELDIYFVEPSPARRGDYIEFIAEVDVLCAFSNCRGGDLSVLGRGPLRGDSSKTCKPLGITVYDVEPDLLRGWRASEPVQVRSIYGQGSAQGDIRGS